MNGLSYNRKLGISKAILKFGKPNLGRALRSDTTFYTKIRGVRTPPEIRKAYDEIKELDFFKKDDPQDSEFTDIFHISDSIRNFNFKEKKAPRAGVISSMMPINTEILPAEDDSAELFSMLEVPVDELTPLSEQPVVLSVNASEATMEENAESLRRRTGPMLTQTNSVVELTEEQVKQIEARKEREMELRRRKETGYIREKEEPMEHTGQSAGILETRNGVPAGQPQRDSRFDVEKRKGIEMPKPLPGFNKVTSSSSGATRSLFGSRFPNPSFTASKPVNMGSTPMDLTLTSPTPTSSSAWRGPSGPAPSIGLNLALWSDEEMTEYRRLQVKEEEEQLAIRRKEMEEEQKRMNGTSMEVDQERRLIDAHEEQRRQHDLLQKEYELKKEEQRLFDLERERRMKEQRRVVEKKGIDTREAMKAMELCLEGEETVTNPGANEAVMSQIGRTPFVMEQDLKWDIDNNQPAWFADYPNGYPNVEVLPDYLSVDITPTMKSWYSRNGVLGLASSHHSFPKVDLSVLKMQDLDPLLEVLLKELDYYRRRNNRAACFIPRWKINELESYPKKEDGIDLVSSIEEFGQSTSQFFLGYMEECCDNQERLCTLIRKICQAKHTQSPDKYKENLKASAALAMLDESNSCDSDVQIMRAKAPLLQADVPVSIVTQDYFEEDVRERIIETIVPSYEGTGITKNSLNEKFPGYFPKEVKLAIYGEYHFDQEANFSSSLGNCDIKKVKEAINSSIEVLNLASAQRGNKLKMFYRPFEIELMGQEPTKYLKTNLERIKEAPKQSFTQPRPFLVLEHSGDVAILVDGEKIHSKGSSATVATVLRAISRDVRGTMNEPLLAGTRVTDFLIRHDICWKSCLVIDFCVIPGLRRNNRPARDFYAQMRPTLSTLQPHVGEAAVWCLAMECLQEDFIVLRSKEMYLSHLDMCRRTQSKEARQRKSKIPTGK